MLRIVKQKNAPPFLTKSEIKKNEWLGGGVSLGRSLVSEASKEKWRRYSKLHRAELNAKARARYQLNKDKEKGRREVYAANNREKLLEIWREYDARPERKARKAELEKTEKRKAVRRAYRLTHRNPEYFREYEKRYRTKRKELHNHKQQNDPQYRIRRALRSSLKNAIKHEWRGGSAIDNLGCSIDELRIYLERLWLDGMNWSNFGRLKSSDNNWQIDHIKPLSSFDLTDPAQVAEACHFKNLAPLWAIDNRRKGNKTIGRSEVQYAL
jgi:hypothetical protein